MVAVTHPFVSGISDDPAAALAGKVLPSHWNDDHDILMAASSRIAGRKTSGAGAMEELTVSELLDFLSTTEGAIPIRGASTWGTTVTEPGVPTGVVAPFVGTTAPTGWLLCYGQAISRTTYEDLFDVIGTAYGAGDGSTTFNLPDARGRTFFGQDDMGGSAANRLTSTGGIDGASLGAVGGTQTKTLTTTELPEHTHTGTTDSANAAHTHSGTAASSGAHTHSVVAGFTGGATGAQLGGTNNGQPLTSGSDGAHTHTLTIDSANAAHTHAFTTGSSGTGSAFGIINPGQVYNVIIKT